MRPGSSDATLVPHRDRERARNDAVVAFERWITATGRTVTAGASATDALLFASAARAARADPSIFDRLRALRVAGRARRAGSR